jgi:hypothetical protein
MLSIVGRGPVVSPEGCLGLFPSFTKQVEKKDHYLRLSHA